MAALRNSDRAALEGLVDEDVEVALRTGDGDASGRGREAVTLLLGAGAKVWARDFSWQSGIVSAQRRGATVAFSGTRGADHRVDLVLILGLKRGRITQVLLVSAGSLAGRALGALELGMVESADERNQRR